MFEKNKQKISLLSGNRITIKSLSKIRCFWTWPFGHIWGEHESEPGYGSFKRRCTICRRTSFKGRYDGDWMYDILLAYNSTPSEGKIDHIRYSKSKCSINKIVRKYVIFLFIVILAGACIGTCNKYYQFIPDTGLVARPNTFGK